MLYIYMLYIYIYIIYIYLSLSLSLCVFPSLTSSSKDLGIVSWHIAPGMVLGHPGPVKIPILTTTVLQNFGQLDFKTVTDALEDQEV